LIFRRWRNNAEVRLYALSVLAIDGQHLRELHEVLLYQDLWACDIWSLPFLEYVSTLRVGCTRLAGPGADR
jgi:hypothetical protein